MYIDTSAGIARRMNGIVEKEMWPEKGEVFIWLYFPSDMESSP